MLDDLIGQIRSSHGDARHRAIADWAASKDRTLLKVLAATYRNSEVATLRQLAAEAHRLSVNDPHVPGELPPREMDSLTNSVNAFALGDRVRALDELYDAVKHRPAWTENPVIADYAAMLMRVTPQQAVAQLSPPEGESAFRVAKGARWWQFREMAERNMTRATLIRNLAILGVMTGLGLAGLMYVYLTAWLPRASASGVFNLPGLELAVLVQPGRGQEVSWLLLALLAAVVTVADILIRTAIIHVVAPAFVEGLGSPYLYFAHQAVAFRLWFNLIALGALVLLFLFSADTLAGASVRRAAEETGRVATLAYLWSLVSFASYVVLMTGVVKESYRVSVVSAAILLAISMIAMLVLGFLLSLLIGRPMPSLPGVFG